MTCSSRNRAGLRTRSPSSTRLADAPSLLHEPISNALTLRRSPDSILNDGDRPSAITTSNSIEWTSAGYSHDYEPLIDLGAFRWVRSIRISYIVALDWNKEVRTMLIPGWVA